MINQSAGDRKRGEEILVRRVWKFIGASVFWAESGGPHGCQNVVPNANDVVDSHLTRDYPLNGGLRPVANQSAWYTATR